MEVWKEIESNPDYQVSNLGRVRSFKGVNQWAARRLAPKTLSPSRDGRGYLCLVLDNGNPNKRHCKVHRLVLETFQPTNDSSLEVNHLNEDKEDNSLVNLSWVTRRENQIYSFGKSVTLISPSQEVLSFESIRMAAELTGLDNAALSRLVSGKYKHTKGWMLHE